MQEKRKALGRGLEQLFNDQNLDFDSFEEAIIEDAKRNDEIIDIKLEDLRPNPYQPRKVFDENALNELAISIKQQGVFQPIIVKKSIKGYEIIAGERRYRASKIAGLKTIPAIVKDYSDDDMMQIALLENLQRENLTSIEEAKAYKSIIDTMHITQEELAKKVGKSRSHITNMLGLLNLPESIQKEVGEKKLSMGHARVLSKLESKDQIEKLAIKVVDDGISVHDLESLVSSPQYERTVKITRKKVDNSEFKYLEKHMKEKLGTNVKISNNKMTIKFANVQDLNRILEIMNINIDE